MKWYSQWQPSLLRTCYLLILCLNTLSTLISFFFFDSLKTSVFWMYLTRLILFVSSRPAVGTSPLTGHMCPNDVARCNKLNYEKAVWEAIAAFSRIGDSCTIYCHSGSLLVWENGVGVLVWPYFAPSSFFLFWLTAFCFLKLLLIRQSSLMKKGRFSMLYCILGFSYDTDLFACLTADFIQCFQLNMMLCVFLTKKSFLSVYKN